MNAASTDPAVIVRYADLVLLVMAVPFALAFGAPALGFAVGAGAWVAQRGIGFVLDGAARKADKPQSAVGLQLASMMARAWLTGLAILLVGTQGEREDGLTAAITVIFAFTVYFVISLFTRRRA